jgi:YhcH/YjgK/YiaL family protein
LIKKIVGDIEMIYDAFENMHFYCKEGDRLFKAIKYAMDFDLSKPDGDYEVDGTNMIAKVQSYGTSPTETRKFEAHKEYYDVQVIRVGCERQDIALAAELEPLAPFDTVKDVVKFKAPNVFSSVVMDPGKFVVYFPQDIHRPNCNLTGACKVRKICMKVKVRIPSTRICEEK